MSQRTLVWIGVLVGSTIGSIVPGLFGAGLLSYWGILGSGIGGIAGVLIAMKIGQNL